MTGARSACARPRKRAARTVARDRVVAASTTGRGREVRRGFISLEIISKDRCHSKKRTQAHAAGALRSGRPSVVLGGGGGLAVGGVGGRGGAGQVDARAAG